MIISLVTAFRKTIETMDISLFPSSIFFESFPRGCCGDTSHLLLEYLAENGIYAEYVWGLYGNQSHAWLETKEFIIDITADQFEDIHQKTIVTSDKTWHSKFENQKRENYRLDEISSFNSKRLRTIYNNVILSMN